MLPTFDNHDSRIRYVPLRLWRDSTALPSIPLPEGYSFRFYRPGDRDVWIGIEQSAKEFETFDDGVKAWETYYAGHLDELPGRMLFVVGPDGEDVGTATAFYDVPDGDRYGDGFVHWVAVRRDRQGRGLSKPLIARCMRRLAELGHTRFQVPTQTTTWVACKVYLDLGFRPTARSAKENELGWRIVARLTGHPTLSGFTPAGDDEVMNEYNNP